MLCVDSIPIQISLQTHFEELLQQASHRKLWEVLLLDMSFFFHSSLGAGQFGNQNRTEKTLRRQRTRGSRQQPIGSGPLHSSATWDEYTLAGRMWGEKREKKHDFSWPFTTTLLTSALNGTLNYNQAEQ